MTLPAILTSILAEELIFRGILQRALEESWSRIRFGIPMAALVTIAVACLATPIPLAAAAAIHTVASLLRATTGRTSTPIIARVTLLLTIGLLAYSAAAQGGNSRKEGFRCPSRR